MRWTKAKEIVPLPQTHAQMWSSDWLTYSKCTVLPASVCVYMAVKQNMTPAAVHTHTHRLFWEAREINKSRLTRGTFSRIQHSEKVGSSSMTQWFKLYSQHVNINNCVARSLWQIPGVSWYTSASWCWGRLQSLSWGGLYQGETYTNVKLALGDDLLCVLGSWR